MLRRSVFCSFQKPIIQHFCNVVPSQDKLSVSLSTRNGLPEISVPLPSKHILCKFILKPTSNTVSDFLRNIRNEDKGIERAVIYNSEKVQIAGSTLLGDLIRDDFMLRLNDDTYVVSALDLGPFDNENMEKAYSQLKSIVYQMYTTFNAEEFALEREKKLLNELENIKEELEPIEQMRKTLAAKAERRSSLVMWGGCAYMALQFGLFARLTWWEYSWDIMEPVTYFAGYATAMVAYGYYLVTRQEYILPDVKDRSYLIGFYKGAKQTQFDVIKYNQLMDRIAQIEMDLKRLRDPLALHLPITPPKSPYN